MILITSTKSGSNTRIEDSIGERYCILVSFLYFEEFPPLSLNNKIDPSHINVIISLSTLFTSFKFSQFMTFISIHLSLAKLMAVARQIFADYKIYSYFFTFIQSKMSKDVSFFEEVAYHFPILAHLSHS